MELLPCPFCGSAAKIYEDEDGYFCVACMGECFSCTEPHDEPEYAAVTWNQRALDPALLALAKLGALVLDWSPLECGFPTMPGGVIDAMAVKSGCAIEDSGDGGHACWTGAGVRLAIARLLAPADGDA